MRFCLDTEFWERPGRIDWISIGIVREDGVTFYAENPDFSWATVERHAEIDGPEGDTPRWLLENVRPHLKGGDAERVGRDVKHHLLSFTDPHTFAVNGSKPKFWAWYGDYDWVVFCWLFGRMIDLPQHFPMYCRDFRQVCEQYGIRGKDLAPETGQEHDALADARRLHDMMCEFEKRYSRLEGTSLMKPNPLA